MPELNLTRNLLSEMKLALLQVYPALRSSHATEVLAFAVGFKTHAALSAALKAVGEEESVACKFEGQLRGRIAARLKGLGYGNPPIRELAEFELKAQRMILEDSSRRHWRSLNWNAVNDN
jgi:hypothetical protein